LDDQKQTLIWGIGQRFASRNLEVALPASIVFDGVSRPTDIVDPFCVGTSCYVQVLSRSVFIYSFIHLLKTRNEILNTNEQARFKINNFTLSGLNIEPKSVMISPTSKVQVVVTRETLGDQYFIWNSLGTTHCALLVHFLHHRASS